MKTHIATKGLELTPELEKYIARKLARLNHKVPRKLRAEAGYEVSLAQVTRKGAKYNTCELLLTLGAYEFVAKETTLHMYAALDIVVVQVERQVKAAELSRRYHIFRRKIS